MQTTTTANKKEKTMVANVTKLYLLELYTWKTCVGMIAVLLLAPAVVKLVEKLSDWWYWRKRK